MKKPLIILITLFIVVIIMVTVIINSKQNGVKEIKQFNDSFEQYIGKQIYGTEVTTVIGKAIKNNENYNIKKDENVFYISDDNYCIKVELNMITVEKTYQMEQLYKAGLTEFVKNFNVITFECTNIEYHNKTGRISKIVFTQLEE